MTATELSCGSCGTALNGTAKFCSECGTAVACSTKLDGTPRTGPGDLRVGSPVARCSVAGRAGSRERLLGDLVPPLLFSVSHWRRSGNGVRRLRSIRRKIGLAIEQGGCFLRLDPKTGAISSSGMDRLSDRGSAVAVDSVPSRAGATGRLRGDVSAATIQCRANVTDVGQNQDTAARQDYTADLQTCVFRSSPPCVSSGPGVSGVGGDDGAADGESRINCL